MFETIKELCKLNSEEMARQYLNMRGGKSAEDNEHKRRIVLSHKEGIEKLCRQFGIHPGFGTVRTRVQNPYGEWAGVSAFVQTFAHQAEALAEWIRSLAAAFDIRGPIEPIQVVEPEEHSEIFFQSEYFLSGEECFAVNLSNGALLKANLGKMGGAVKESGNVITISRNVETEVTIDGLVRQVVQIKLGKRLDQIENSDMVLSQVHGKLRKRLNVNPHIEVREIIQDREERSRIYNHFKDLNEQLTILLGNLSSQNER